MTDHDNRSFELGEHIHEDSFYVIMTRYVRENDLHEVLSEEVRSEQNVVWSLDHVEERTVDGVRDGFLNFVRQRGVL